MKEAKRVWGDLKISQTGPPDRWRDVSEQINRLAVTLVSLERLKAIDFDVKVSVVTADPIESLGKRFKHSDYQKEGTIVTVCAKGIRIGADVLELAPNPGLVCVRYWSVVGAHRGR